MLLLVSLLLLMPSFRDLINDNYPPHFDEVSLSEHIFLEVQVTGGELDRIYLVSGFQGDPRELYGRTYTAGEAEAAISESGGTVVTMVPDAAAGYRLSEDKTYIVGGGSYVAINVAGVSRDEEYLLLGFSQDAADGSLELKDFADVTSVVLFGHSYRIPGSFYVYSLLGAARPFLFAGALALLAWVYAKIRKLEGRQPIVPSSSNVTKG